MRFLRRNVLWVYAVYAASFVSGLVVPPILLHSLGQDALAIWFFIGSATGYVRVLDFGVGPSIVRFGARHRGAKDEEATNALASVGLVVYSIIGLVTVAVGVALAFVIPHLIDASGHLAWETRVATLLVVAGIAVDFVIGIFTDLLGAQQRYDVINLAGLVSVVVYAGLVIGVLTNSGGLIMLSAIVLLATVVRLVLPIFWVPRELPFLRPRRRYVTLERVRELLSFSWHNFLIHIAARATYGTDILVVGIVLGKTATTVYGLPAKIFAVGFGLATAAPNLLYPAVAEAEGARDLDRQRWYLRGGLRVGMALMLIVALPLALIPHDCLLAWGIGSGPNRLTAHQLDQAATVLSLLAVALIVSQPLNLATKFMVARGRPELTARILLGSVAVNVVLSVALAQTVGVWGIAVGTLVGQLGALLVLPRLVARSAGVSIRSLAVASLRPVLPALAAAVVVFGVARFLHPDTRPSLAAVGLVWIVVGTAAVWLFGLAPEDRAAIGRNALRRSAKASPEPEPL